MNKKHYLIALGLALTLSSTGYAANPTTKEYVDTQVKILQSQIAAIPAGNQGPQGLPGVPGAQGPAGADGVGGITMAGAGVSVTGAGSGSDPYVVSTTIPDPGEPFGGGKVACTVASGGIKNLIATIADGPAAFWSHTTGTTVPSPGATSLTNGRSNTMAAYTQNRTPPSAAQICYELLEGGYQDWYLPAKDELYCLYQNQVAIGGFSPVDYWSSSESAANNAWYKSFSSVFQGEAFKNTNIRVRCVRAITN